MRDNYNIQFSFNDNELSKVKVSRNFTATNAENAIMRILENTGFMFMKTGDVFLIYPAPQAEQQRKYIISGKIVDKVSGEPLPFAHARINKRGLVSDLNGNYNFVVDKDTVYKLQVSFLGYYVLDTSLTIGKHTLELMPSSIGITEVVIKDQLINHSLQIGSQSGLMRLNNKIIKAIPGNGDNSVFNLLRLQPGILAAGEQSSDLIIWGSYGGQSQVLFDGFALFGIKNFNDNISAVNPFMVKDMQVYKGAYGAKYGERVGGIVDIAGYEGATDKPSVDLNVNNMTMNAKASIPLFKNTSITGAFRKTYYNLYEPQKVTPKKDSESEELILNPDYGFRDFNLKLSGDTENGSHYYISLYNGTDDFNYSFDYEKINDKGNTSLYTRSLQEQNNQTGAAAYYNKIWNNGLSNSILAGYSGLKSFYDNGLNIIRLNKNRIINTNEYTENNIEEYFVKNENRLAISETHAIEFGVGYYLNKAGYSTDSLDINLIQKSFDTERVYAYIQDDISLGNHLSVVPGLRVYYVPVLKKVFGDPRFKASIKFNNKLKFNASWGVHHQFITKSSVIDENSQYRYLWAVCNDDKIPVLNSKHYVAGPAFNNKGFTVSVEGFYKKTEGLTRYKKISKLNLEDVFEGKSKSYGLDFFVKKEHRGHSFWLAYTLSKTQEHFSYYKKSDYRQALHDQRHELKCASVLNFKSIYFSMNYVYGSGLTDPFPNDDGINSKKYSRFDVSGVYKLKIKKVNLETGLSVLNVFNTQNLKYSSFVRLPADEQTTLRVFTEAVPFTPTLFLNVSF